MIFAGVLDSWYKKPIFLIELIIDCRPVKKTINKPAIYANLS